MVTTVGMQSDFEDAIKSLIELDYDAVEAYEVAIEKIKSPDHKTELTGFKEDHERHIRELNQVLTQRQLETVTSPSSKQWLTKGKVYLGSLIGDKTILMAMKSNEIDTNTAYERVLEHQDQWEETRDILRRGLEDERRHKAWLETILDSDSE